MDQLRDEVRTELVKNGITEEDDTIEIQRGTESLALQGGIADAEGLGWAGKSQYKPARADGPKPKTQRSDYLPHRSNKPTIWSSFPAR